VNDCTIHWAARASRAGIRRLVWILRGCCRAWPSVSWWCRPVWLGVRLPPSGWL